MHYRLDPGVAEREHAHLEGDEQSCSPKSSDEMYAIVAGEVVMTVDGERAVLRAGDAVYAPAGTVHGVVDGSDAPAELILVFGPPRAERSRRRSRVVGLRRGAASGAPLPPGTGSCVGPLVPGPLDLRRQAGSSTDELRTLVGSAGADPTRVRNSWAKAKRSTGRARPGAHHAHPLVRQADVAAHHEAHRLFAVGIAPHAAPPIRAGTSVRHGVPKRCAVIETACSRR